MEHKSISEHRIFPSLTGRFSYFRLEVRNTQKGEFCALLVYHLAYRLLTDVLWQPIGSGDPRRKLSYWISWPLSIRPIGCPLLSVRNYPYTLRNNPEKHNLIYFASEASSHTCGKEASDIKAFNTNVTDSGLTSKVLVDLRLVVMYRSCKEIKHVLLVRPGYWTQRDNRFLETSQLTAAYKLTKHFA
jgi:hypothetical protein